MSTIQVFTDSEIESFRKAGKILRACLDYLAEQAVEGVSTIELDRKAEAFIVERGGIPAFKGYSGYPFTLCTSVNEECVHGMPSDRVLQDGDIISIDCGVKLDGLNTDACITVPVGTISKDAEHLLEITKGALEKAVSLIKGGLRTGDLSAGIQEAIEAGGCTAVRSLTGHGLGTDLHAYPDIPNIGKKGTGPVLPAGTVIAVEPIVTLGDDDIREATDGWTLITENGSLAAHFEHTILVTEQGCEVLA